MKKLFAVTFLCLLLLAGCGKKAPAPDATESLPTPTMNIDSGEGEAVVPEEGDIVIPIGE